MYEKNIIFFKSLFVLIQRIFELTKLSANLKNRNWIIEKELFIKSFTEIISYLVKIEK